MKESEGESQALIKHGGIRGKRVETFTLEKRGLRNKQ